MVTRVGFYGPGIESQGGGGKIFRTRPERPWGPPSHLNNGSRVFSGEGGIAGRPWRWPPTPSSAEVKEKVELYLYSKSGPSWPGELHLYFYLYWRKISWPLRTRGVKLKTVLPIVFILIIRGGTLPS